MFEIVDDDNDTHTISSPCEPRGLGELKYNIFMLMFIYKKRIPGFFLMHNNILFIITSDSFCSKSVCLMCLSLIFSRLKSKPQLSSIDVQLICNLWIAIQLFTCYLNVIVVF